MNMILRFAIYSLLAILLQTALCGGVLAEDEGYTIEVTSSTGVIKDSGKTISEVPRGTRLWVFREQDENWLLVKAPDVDRQGWINRDQIRQLKYPSNQIKQQVEKPFHEGNRLMDRKSYYAAVKSYQAFHSDVQQRFGRIHATTIRSKERLASAFQKRDQPGDAELADNLFTESVRAARVLWGRFRGETGVILANHAILKRALGKGKLAEEMYREAISIGDRLNQPSALHLHNFGILLTLRGDTHEAIKVLEKGEKVASENRSANSSTARGIRVLLQEARSALAAQQASQTDLPSDLAEVVDFDSSHPHLAINRHNAPSFQEMIRGASLSLKPNATLPDPQQYFQHLVDALPHSQRRGDKAALSRRAVAIQLQAETTDPEENYQLHRKVIALMSLAEENKNHLAYVMATMVDFAITAGHYEEAGEALQVASQILEDKIVDDMAATGAILSMQGKLSGTLGDPTHAVACYRRAIALNYIAAQQWDIVAIPFDRADRLNAWIQSRNRESLPVIVRTILIKHDERQRDIPNPMWSWVTTDLPDLAAKQSLLGHFDQAIKTLQVAESIGIHQFGENHLELAGTYLRQGIVYSRLSEHDLAKVSLNKSLTILKRHYGNNAQIVANCEIALANAHRQLKEYAQAVEHQQAGTRVLQRVLPSRHPESALAQARLGAIKVDMGQFMEAEALLTEAMPVVEKGLGSLHPDLIECRVLLGEIHAASGNTDKAIDEFRAVVEQLRIYSATALASQTEQQQLAFLAYTFQNCERRTMQALYPHVEKLGVKRALVETILNTRGFALECLTQRYQLAQSSDSPQVIQLRTELDKARAELAAAFTNQAERAVTDEIVQRMEALSSQLSQLTGKNLAINRWLSLDNIRIKSDSALVLLHRANWQLNRSTSGERPQENYVAFVVHEDGTINTFALGKRRDVNDAVAECRRMLSPHRIDKLGPAKAERTLHDSLRQLSDLVISPLATDLGDVKHWIISPDGPLWSIPFQCLLLANDNYVVERHNISYINSHHDRTPSERSTDADTALILANPDYNAELTRSRENPSVESAPPPPEHHLVAPRAGIFKNWSQLPGTQLELDAAKPHISHWLGLQAGTIEHLIVTDSQASEAAIRNCTSPKVLSLSTHGFFLQPPRPGGLGVNLTRVAQGLKVIGIQSESAAEQDGRLQTNDIIVSVIDESSNRSISLADKLVFEASSYFQGKPGTNVTFDVIKAKSGERVTYVVPRKTLPKIPTAITSSDTLTSPLLRCGLVFAGANRPYGTDRHLNDGYLSGIEICSLDLQGTDLVVLSACETGLGDSFSMEGVVGLRHAFQSAGAQSVVSTLWQIPDQQTATLMESFWKQLANGATKSASLCEAQRAMIRNSVDSDSPSSHPFYWAAFTHTGKLDTSNNVSSLENSQVLQDRPLDILVDSETESERPADDDHSEQVTSPEGEDMPAAPSNIAGQDQAASNGYAIVLVDTYLTSRNGKVRFYRVPTGTRVLVIQQTDGFSQVSFVRGGRTLKGWISPKELQHQ